MQTILMYFCLAGLVATLLALFGIWLWRMDSQPVKDALSGIRRHPIAVQLALLVFVVRLFVYGSAKTNGNGYVEGGATNGPTALPPPLMMLAGEMPTVFGFTSSQLAAGFVLSRVDAAGSRSFAPPPGASVVEAWRLRGAADDWARGPASASFPGGSVVFADGRVQDSLRNPAVAFSPFRTTLGVVPEANWPLIAGSNAESMVWHATTPSNSVVVMWKDVLFRRDTNTPVSVQAEFFENGDFDYRYGLESVKCKVESGELGVEDLTNIVVGASLGGMPFQMPLADIVADSSLSILNSPFSICFRALVPEDAAVADRDGDGISTYDEIFTYHTDPGLFDSDGDGISDGDEIAQSLDPLAVSVSNEALLSRLDDFQTNISYAAASVSVTNELVGYRLWDSFAATWPAGATNLVYERTVRIDSRGGWQHYYLSSRPDAAGGWSLAGLVLEWEDSCGGSGTATASPVADSLYLPLSTNGPSSVTFRLRATSPDLRSVNPVYLVGYAPAVSIEGGRKVTTAAGDVLDVFTGGAESAIGVAVDRSRRPCKATPTRRELSMDGLADLEARTGGELRYEGDACGGVIVASGAGVYRLPDMVVSGVEQTPPMRGSNRGVGSRYLVVLTPWVRYGEHHCAGGGLGWDEGGGYFIEYEYPLDSGCLVREWHRGAGGEWICDCAPEAGCGLGDGNGFATVDVEVDGETATATVRVGGEAVWSDSATHVRGADGCGDDLAIEGGECGDCESGCERGDCSGLEGPSLGSFRFRIPLGVPRKGQVAGFAYLMSEGPLAVTPASFQYLLRGDVGATVATNGSSRTVSCACERGRTLQIEPMPNGARAVVREQATGALEHMWEVVNVGGSQGEIRVRQISRLDNVMQDWTYECVEDAESGGWSWRATDNIAGIREELERSETLNGDGLVSEVRTKYDAEGNWLGEVETVSQIVGERERAVLREVFRREETGFNTVERTADYWRDDEHPARNGKLRLLLGDDMPWEYHEWSKDGFEPLRVGQRNGSPVPDVFPSATSNGFENASGLTDAFLTTFSYEPIDGDGAHPDDYGKARCESRYVVRDGAATLVGRSWRRYTHIAACGYPAVKEETWRAASVGSERGDSGNAYSWRTVFDPLSAGVPLVLRGKTAEEVDEDGVRTVADVSVSGGRVVLTRRRWRGELQFPTCEVVELDGAYGLELRRATRLSDGDAEIDWSESAYDDQGRLRSRVYHDGTSETNAYSCCRLLWKRDREGRKTLRSAVTGTDRLYNAYEDFWITNVTSATNHQPPTTNHGFRVTQHFFDGLGRETNTVVGISYTPGTAASPASTLHSTLYTLHSFYPYGGSDYSVGTDERGKVTIRRVDILGNSIETGEAVFTNGVEVVKTKSRSYFGGGSSIRREWPVGRDDPIAPGGSQSLATAWTEERRFTDYAADGCRIDYVVTESSDRGTVTNSVSTYDLLGRLVSSAVRGANGSTIATVNAYDGTTARILSAATTGSPVVAYGYNLRGERVSTSQDGKSILNETSYETISQQIYRVVTSVRMTGSTTNAVRIQKTQLTGLSDACRRHVMTQTGKAAILAATGTTGVPPVENGSITDSLAVYNPSTGIETTLTRTDGQTPVVTRSIYGVTLGQTSIDGAREMAYDAFGRNVFIATSNPDGVTNRLDFLEYDQSGNVVRRVTDLMDGRVAEATAEYDMLNREVRRTDALGHVTETAYDALGRTVSTSGDAYPIMSGYDTAGRKTRSFTTRDNGATWDETRWEFDPASGVNTAKEYADGSRVAYSYTDNGKKTRTTWARGSWKQNAYNERNLVSGTTYSGTATPSVAYTYADSGKTESATLSDGTAYAYSYDYSLLCTNEAATIGEDDFTITRTYDGFLRNEETSVMVTNVRHSAKVRLYDSEDRVCGYALTNASGRGVSVTLAYDGSYVTNTVYTLPNGGSFSARLTREAGRRNLVTRRDYFFGGQSIYWYSTEYDLLNRPTNATDSVSLVREWLYNRRSELAAATVGTDRYGYAYDTIGNRLWSAANLTTNTYAANSLNQYTLVGRAVPSAPGSALVYDADGNLTNDGIFSYSYDAENRLIAAYPISSVVGALAVENRYDHRHRRIQKVVKSFDGEAWVTAESRTFVWDGNNIVLEKVEFANGTTRTSEYFWGADKSGTEQGAGGVEGLLAVSMDGVFYIPCYDHNGNIVLYVSETGSTAAQYTYDPYGNIIDSSGSLANVFSFGFSTKCHDRETGMVGYKRRFYRPDLGRWLNRDPIEEEGGENLYAFCANNPIFFIDISGESFWGYFVDTAKTLSGAFTMAAGFTLGAAAGWTGIGAVGAVGLIAMGADQFTSGVRNLVNRAQGRSVSNNTYVQIAYKYAAEKITGRTDSGLEKTLDGLYFAAEVVSACATGAMSISGSITAVRSVGTAHTAHRWVSVNGYVRMELYMTASVSTVEAGCVVATETFSTTLSAISFFTSPTNDVESVNVEGGGNDY